MNVAQIAWMRDIESYGSFLGFSKDRYRDHSFLGLFTFLRTKNQNAKNAFVGESKYQNKGN